ncbi:UPF0058 family protein [Methanotorris igneus]|uniref:Uncharacterized protein n=1 Tax=Methanotorris igneus (strain DSM 5666 / JCM 11834 / Kol 5) TaxID=880724 RepID=F6BBM2_METIK|nr:UPF0058 family protein [Methanotorris igneus]AEF96031.1 protein of unknown function UPF0058 [Methanotorris igneus Kol 5]
MHKEQLMELHQFFVHVVRELLDDNDNCDSEYLRIYEKLDIKPHYIHKLKVEQRAAIFLLSASIAEILSKNGEKVPENLARRLAENAFKYLNNKRTKSNKGKKLRNSKRNF